MELAVKQPTGPEEAALADAASKIVANPNDTKAYGLFDSKAVEFFSKQKEALGKSGELTASAYDKSLFGTRSVGVQFTNQAGESVALTNRLSGPEAGMTNVARRDSGNKLVKDADVPSAVSFEKGKIRNVLFAKAKSEPSYGDEISKDTPTEASFDAEGRMAGVNFGDSAGSTRAIRYHQNGKMSMFSYHEKGGAGSTTNFNQDGTLENKSAPVSAIRSSYEKAAPETFRQNLTENLKSCGLTDAIPTTASSISMLNGRGGPSVAKDGIAKAVTDTALSR